MRNYETVLAALKLKLNAIHIVSEYLSNTEREYLESKILMENKLKEIGLFVPMWELYLRRTYGTKGFHVVGNKYHGDYMLKDMNLSGMDLSGMDFSHVHFQNCDLSYCNLSNTNFDGAYLSFTNITGANIRNSNFSNVCYSGVKCYPLKLDAYGANLNNAYFSRVNLSKSNFQCASLHGTYLSGCILNNVNFAYGDLTDACLSYAELHNTNMYHAILDFVSFYKAAITGCTNLDKAKCAQNVCIDSATIRTTDIYSVKELASIVCLILFIIIGLGMTIK